VWCNGEVHPFTLKYPRDQSLDVHDVADRRARRFVHHRVLAPLKVASSARTQRARLIAGKSSVKKVNPS